MRIAIATALLTAAAFAQEPVPPRLPEDPHKPQHGPRPFDPFRGMDASGRIPKPQLPDDLAHPERWRYYPPARIKPGTMLDRFWVSSFVSPILFREEDIGFGGGLALTDIDFLNDNFRQFANIVTTYSAEGQQAYRFNWSRWLNHRTTRDGGVLREERARLYARGGYSRTLTRRFFGFGSRTPESNETSYTEDLSQIGFGLRLPVPDQRSDWVMRVDVDARRHSLASGQVSSVASMDAQVPDAFEDGDGVDQLWLTGRLAWDTRDSFAQPYGGERVGVAVATAWQRGG
ncbi:MAG: hypothetical protein VXY92_03980, partial [Planctomycetota bacterium]|nr:hypothetical protein [Planctomycetota bacterium]